MAIYASGGLSRFFGEFNMTGSTSPSTIGSSSAWSALTSLEALKHLFAFDSDNMRAGTGEVRAWISLAAAMKRPATVVEYVVAHRTATGCGFA